MACIYLGGHLAQETSGVDVTKTPIKTARWYGLSASSLVVMGSAVRAFSTSDCDQDLVGVEIKYCKRSKLAISMGVLGFFFAAIMTMLTRYGLTIRAEMIATTLQLILWCFAVGYITFGTSPGSTIGNLFFGTWISFVLTVFLFGQCFREYVAARQAVFIHQTSDEVHHQENNDEQYDDRI